ncbi:serine/threonine protein kinase [Escherichia coli]|uniref:serine/threonine protein kinase n=1 Tax=Escherichia coli TaxID=562 RepID=UPI003F1F95E8
MSGNIGANPLPFSAPSPFVRSCLSWHYPNSPKNGKPAISPRHDWLKTGFLLQNAPLRIWFYPQ